MPNKITIANGATGPSSEVGPLGPGEHTILASSAQSFTAALEVKQGSLWGAVKDEAGAVSLTGTMDGRRVPGNQTYRLNASVVGAAITVEAKPVGL